NGNLREPVLALVEIQHELREGTREPRSWPPEHDETRLRNLAGPLEVHHAERLTKLEVLSGLEREPSAIAPAADPDVVVGSPPTRHGRMPQIRQLQQQILERAVSVPRFNVEPLDPVAKIAHAAHLALGRLALPPCAADRLGGAVPLRL